MRKLLRNTVLTLSAITLIVSVSVASVSTTVVATDSSSVVNKSTTRATTAEKGNAQRSFFSTFRNFLPFRSNNVENEKLLSNVKIFPNPVAEHINLSFRLGKQSSVSIKVMDALGNEVMTLLNQELEAGAQNHAFETNNKLTNGFYFIRVSAGTETVVKRISVL